MRILHLIAIMAMTALIVGLGARAVMTGMAIAGSRNGGDADIIDDSKPEGFVDYEKAEPKTVTSVDYIDVVAEGEAKSSGKGSGGGGSGGGGDSGDDDSDPVPEDLCSEDSDCDDGNDLTIDSCKSCVYDENYSRKECVNIIPNIYGKVYDTDKDDEGLPEIKISFYDDDTYDPYEDNGTYSDLEPKATPDAVTDENGIYAAYVDPDEIYHMVLQGSDEKAFNVRSRKNPDTDQKIITERDGYIKVYFEKASASLKSDLYIEEPVEELLIENSGVGEVVYINNSQVYDAGTELRFSILVHGTGWGIGEYKHYSDSKYAQVERLDSDTWRIHFEDLPASWPPDWDFNDAVVLVDVVGNITNETAYDDDCDEDGIVNWLDNNDSCDVGEEDQEIDENNPEVENFNAEGHILFSGKYGEGNKYVCGDKLLFTMFGINHGTEEENITFMVEDHIDGGNQGIWVYNGSLDNEDESLIVPADGTKYHKNFEFEIPCSFRDGKHDIHIIWDGEKFHKIGNFFVVEDTTNPWINAQENASGFPDETITIDYSASDPAEDGTVREFEIAIAEGANETLTINVAKDATKPEDVIVIEGGGEQVVNMTYNESGEYNAILTVIDRSGRNDSVTVPVTIFITEEEADDIAQVIYNDFGFSTPMNSWIGNIFGVDRTWDRYDDMLKIGDEYLSDESEIDEEVMANINQNNVDCGGKPYMRIISPCTAEVYNNTLTNFLSHVLAC